MRSPLPPALRSLARRLQRRRWTAIALFLGVCTAILASCSTTPTADLGGQDGDFGSRTLRDRLRLGTTAQIVTLDPADAYEQSSMMAIANLGDPLYGYRPNALDIVPRLARELPDISDDGLTYRIPLRRDVVFHDGTPFNAEAMAFSLRRFIENKGRPSFLLADAVDRITATADDELTLTLNYPFAAFTALLTFPGLCAVSPSAYTIGEGEFAPNQFVGTGPYQLDEFGSDGARLTAFPDYWGEPPQNSGVDMQRFSSKANLYNAFRTGAVDVAYQELDPDQIRSLQALEGDRGWQVISSESPTITYLVVNTEQPPLDRLEVRQALAAAMDRDLLNERVFYGQAQPLYSLLPRSFDAHRPVFETQYGDGDLAAARERLRSAGFTPENPLTLEMWFASSSVAGRLSATILQAYAERDLDGLLVVKPRSVEAATAYGYLDKGVYPTFVLSWYADFFDADNYLKPFLDCQEGSKTQGCIEGESQYHGSFFYSDRANELLDRQRQTRDPQQREVLLVELQKMVADTVPYIPLWQGKDYAFAQANVSGVQLSKTQQVLPFAPIQKSD